MSSSASVIGLPLFRVSSSASSRARARTIAASLKSTWPRSCGVERFQSPLSNAWRAADTALSTSAAVASGTRAMTSPVAGSKTSREVATLGAAAGPEQILDFREDGPVRAPVRGVRKDLCVDGVAVLVPIVVAEIKHGAGVDAVGQQDVFEQRVVRAESGIEFADISN